MTTHIDGPLPADPDFPERPTHPDFARLSHAVTHMDDSADKHAGTEELIPDFTGVDKDSLMYMLLQRDVRHKRASKEAALAGSIAPTAMPVAWLDGFMLGVEFARRGGHRDTFDQQ